MRFFHVGEVASSKSAMNTFAPELSALMTILRSTGPVISVRRSCKSAGIEATRHDLSSRMDLVAREKIRHRAAINFLLPLDAFGEKFLARRLKFAGEFFDEGERLRSQDFGHRAGNGCFDFHRLN